MEQSNNDTELGTFMEITGCSNIETARGYLSFGGGLENAISLYMTSQEPHRPTTTTATSPDVQFISETIRNPIESRTEQLIDDFSMHYDEELDSDYHEPFHQPEPIEVDRVWQRNDTLSALFAPPTDIIFNGTVARGKKVAVEKNKQLLLTIHDPSDFQCQVLNRDLWKNKEVKEVIGKHFIFLQVAKSSPDGHEHATFYPFFKYPYICVLDPLTGERIKFWNESPIEPEVFIFELLDLLPSQGPSSSTERSPILGEEEQLRMALLISAGGDPDIIKNETKKANLDAQDPSKLFESIAPAVEEETKDGRRVQFRFPDGKKIVRKFKSTQKVAALFAFIKSQYPQYAAKPFDLINVRDGLLYKLSDTVQDAKVANSSLALDYLS